ncbi:YeeE/YedE thiosulfate transporter family protein [Salinimicrobium sp. MT39]|uniref:YeeE/YedE thiosulfate transporter family protein n=1 Tax=Salinimicrobium profundisediminis TaxID=2994553 RepID=A0A9X3I1R2_9FLAO|nr:YeeE/YedE thiosulfate transporter family protein [Salinimicrobium profundisediminis]MCX2839226.1 YeeE/YedE thiosulfate transporter family protein [Salinimicrobium profundisediminis]
MEMILEPWPWYVAGPLIALVMFLLIFMGKKFGMSSNLETMCTICGAGKKSDYFNVDWKASRWNLLVIVGAAIGGFIGAHLLSNGNAVNISEETVLNLQELGFMSSGEAYLPERLFSLEALGNFQSIMILLVGGVLIGFGARYAAGCTSGHAISGLSNLQLPSLIAVIGFFIGGLVMVHLLFPIIF